MTDPRPPRNPLPMKYGVGVVTWQCSDPRKPCAVLRVFVAPTGYTLLQLWHAPKVAAPALLRRRGTEVSRQTMVAKWLPLDQAEWPDAIDLDLPCRHRAGGRVDLALLREDLAKVNRPHAAVLRKL